jgi:hypothetical protein
MPLHFFALALSAFFLLSACDRPAGNARDGIASADDSTTVEVASDSATASKADSIVAPSPVQPAAHAYHFIRPKDSAGKAELKALSKEQLAIVYALNRVDPGPARRTDTLIIPDQWEVDLMAYSPFPAQVPGLAEVKKIIFFSYPIQAFGVYENGNLVRWGPTSMGKKATPTPTGLFLRTGKARKPSPPWTQPGS